MVHISIVVVPIDDKHTWQWFLEKLLDDIGRLSTTKLSSILDTQKRLVEALIEFVCESENK